MTARILTYHGAQDGLRFGQVIFGFGQKRCYLWDRLAEGIRLYADGGGDGEVGFDDDPRLLREARAAILAHEGRSG